VSKDRATRNGTRATDKPRKGSVYRRHTATARNAGDTCILCGRPIDHTLPHDAAGAPTAEHVDPITTGGHPLGPAGPAHRVCNLRRNNKPLTEDLMRYLQNAPLEYDTPRMGRRQPRNSQDW
jgi:hypothetical protein